MPNYQRQSIHTVDDLKAISDHAGGYFFSPETMKAFASRILEGITALDGHTAKHGHRFLFITSERDTFAGTPRTYRLRMATLDTVRDDRPNVLFDTLSEYATPQQARKAAQEFAYLDGGN